jgi:hypothetical protein
VLSIVGKIILVLNGSAVDGSGRCDQMNELTPYCQNVIFFAVFC